jgi:hypothetical protein
MTWDAPRAYAVGELIDDTILNQYLRDNLLETETAKAQAAGDLFYCSTAAANELTANQAGIEAASGWAAQSLACDTARSTAQAHTGSASLAITSEGVNPVMAAQIPLTVADLVRVGAGEVYEASGWFRANAATRSCWTRVEWYDAQLVLLSTSDGPAIVDSASAWTQAFAAFIAPDRAVYGRLCLVVATPQPSEIHYADDMRLATGGVISRRAIGSSGQWLRSLSGVPAWDSNAPVTALLGRTSYDPASVSTYTTSSATLADVDATNLVLAFTPPSSGKVLIVLSAFADKPSNGGGFWGLRDSGGDIASSVAQVADAVGATVALRPSYRLLFTGLSGAKSWKWAYSRAVSGSWSMYAGGDAGAAVMEAWAVP